MDDTLRKLINEVLVHKHVFVYFDNMYVHPTTPSMGNVRNYQRGKLTINGKSNVCTENVRERNGIGYDIMFLTTEIIYNYMSYVYTL